MVRVTGINNLSSNHRVSVTTKANTGDKYRQIYTYQLPVSRRETSVVGMDIYAIRIYTREFRLKSIWIGAQKAN